MENHCCVKIEPRETDYIAGDGNIKLGAIPPVPDGDWTPYYEFYERQMLNTGDSDGCVLFTAQESFDAQIEQKMQAGTILPETLSLFDALGYMDIGVDGKKHFHSSERWLQILTGNGLNGNNIYDAWDVMRKYGVLPYKDLPVDPTLTPQEYVNPSAITQAMRDKALQFLIAIGGKNAIQYHWILNNKHDFQATIPALQYSPLCDGVNVGSNWNSEYPPAPLTDQPPGHCVGRIKDILPLTAVEYDHYLPNPKYLVNYPISYSLQAIVTITPPPPAPVLPPNVTPATATTSQISIWLQNLVTYFTNIIASISPKGRESSNIPMSNILNLSKSDFVKGAIIAVLTPSVGYLYQVFSGGSLTVDWAQLAKLAGSAFGAYIIKNYFTDKQGNFLGLGSSVSGEITP